jgi:AcrR family transcriptional regulator
MDKGSPDAITASEGATNPSSGSTRPSDDATRGDRRSGPKNRSSAKRQRREDIVAVAVDLFRDKGYASTSMGDIGAAMGMSGPAVYRYFEGKEQILLEAIENNWEPISRSMASAIQLPPEESLKQLVREYTSMTVDNGIYFLLWTSERHHLPASYLEFSKRKQQLYVSEWVNVLISVRPELTQERAHLMIHAAIALMHSTTTYHGMAPNAAKDIFTTLTLQLLLDAPSG